MAPNVLDSSSQQQQFKLTSLQGFSIVYFGNDWHAENRTSSHHIARQISRYLPVLYVDTPGMRSPTASGRDLRKIVRIGRKLLARPKQVGPRLWQLTVPQIPYRNLPAIDRLNQSLGRWLVSRAARSLGFKRRLSWFAVPHPAAMAGQVGDEFVVYYCIDDYASLAQMDAARIQALDDGLSRRANIVFVSSQSLLDRKLSLSRAVQYSPHGVDFDLFGQALHPATVIPESARDLPHPVIGYFGSIAHHTDIETIVYLAQQRPRWTFLLIGMASVDTSSLRALPNIHFTGAQPYETLPGWAKAFDAAIIPYRPWFAAHSSSLKVREYLAAGKPVVTVSTPEIENYRKLVSIAGSPEEFLAKIEQELASDSAEARRARQDAVRDSSWQACAERALTRIQTMVAER